MSNNTNYSDQNAVPQQAGPQQAGPPQAGQYAGPPPQGWQQAGPQQAGQHAGPPQQGPGQYWGPGQYPPPQKPKKKWYQRVWFWILAVILVIIMINVFSGGDGDSSGSSDAAGTSSAANAKDEVKPAAKAEKKAPAMAKIGDSVTSGHFKFTVTKVQKGVSRVGDSYLGEKAQGQFILVSVKVTNVGDSSEMFMGSEQKMFDKSGKEYSADDEAGIYLDESNSFLEDINPGNTVNGKIVFDVPKTVTPKYIEFSGALFSSSVKVALT